MSIQNFNIVSSKSLEKQLKVVEVRIQELQAEIHDLEKIRSACHTLLGTSSDLSPETAEAAQEFPPTPAKKKSAKRTSLNAEEITEEPLLENKVSEAEAALPS